MTPWNTDRTRVWYAGPSGLGGNGVGPTRCVRNGIFRTGAWRTTNRRCLRRRFNGILISSSLFHNRIRRSQSSFLSSTKAHKANFKGVLTGHTVTMTTYYVNMVVIKCSTMFSLFVTTLLSSADIALWY